MGTIIGLLILAGVDVYIMRRTGLHLHQWISKKYKKSQDAKNKIKSTGQVITHSSV